MGDALKSKILINGLVIMKKKKVNDTATKFKERSMAFLFIFSKYYLNLKMFYCFNPFEFSKGLSFTLSKKFYRRAPQDFVRMTSFFYILRLRPELFVYKI